MHGHSCFVDQLYPFGDAVGDALLPSGIALDNTSSPPLTLSSRFRFFGRDEDTLYVSYIHIWSNIYHKGYSTKQTHREGEGGNRGYFPRAPKLLKGLMRLLFS